MPQKTSIYQRFKIPAETQTSPTSSCVHLLLKYFQTFFKMYNSEFSPFTVLNILKTVLYGLVLSRLLQYCSTRPFSAPYWTMFFSSWFQTPDALELPFCIICIFVSVEGASNSRLGGHFWHMNSMHLAPV